MAAYGWSPCHTEDIYACLDIANETGEYWALDDKVREEIRTIIACGVVSMVPGSPIRTRLLQIFPSGVVYNALMAKFADPGLPPTP
jgi:hypothetical protein